MHHAGFAFSLSLSRGENIKAYCAHRRRRDEEMPIFVSHRYFQRASGGMQRQCTALCTVQMHRCSSACWACIGRACAPMCTVVYILHRFYLPTRSLSLLEIYLPRGLHKWKNISTDIYMVYMCERACPASCFVSDIKKKKNYLMATTNDTL